MALSDSQTALKSLYMTYFGPLMRFTGMYVSSPAEAEEIVSDTFLAIWNNRKQLPGISNFDSYIYTVARHKAISYYRKQHMEQVSLDEISIDLFTSTETTPEEELISQEGIHRLNLAIDSLPAKCKMAFKLVREDKLKYKEVAAILDISVKTLEAHLANAVRKLRETLADDCIWKATLWHEAKISCIGYYRGQNQKYNFLFNGRNRIKHWKTNKNKNKRLTEASLFKVESIWIWF